MPTTEIAPAIEDQDDLAAFIGSNRYREGGRQFVAHLTIERDRKLVKDAKKLFKLRYGSLKCEVCGFSFESIYGPRGKNFIEAHHRKPISELNGRAASKIKDLAMVCSNCHRMLHRAPYMTTDALRDMLGQTAIS